MGGGSVSGDIWSGLGESAGANGCWIEHCGE